MSRLTSEAHRRPEQSQLREPRFTAARYQIGGPVPPPVVETLPLAEQARRALMHLYAHLVQKERYGEATPPVGERIVSEVFSGKDARGQALSGHGHAFYLPTDEDGDGHLDHLTVVASRGFDADEVRALDRLRFLRFGPGESLALMLVGLGTERDLVAPLFGASREWESATPFLVTRHPKRRGRKRDRPELLGRENEPAFVAAVLREELDRLRARRPDLAELAEVVPLPERRIGPRGLRPFAFCRSRRKPGDDGDRRLAGAFRLVFAAPVTGPICLGHSCHFGLGLFLPAEAPTHPPRPDAC